MITEFYVFIGIIGVGMIVLMLAMWKDDDD